MDAREYDIKQKFLNLDTAIRSSCADLVTMRMSLTALNELKQAVMEWISLNKGGMSV